MTYLGQLALFTALYVVAGLLGLELTQTHDKVTLLIWPPGGLSMAALILFGRRLWPGIFIGTILITLVLPSSGLLPVGIAIGNTLEALIGVTLLLRLVGFRPTLERMRDGVAFLLISVIGCTAISTTIGVGSIFLWEDIETSRFWPVWLIWWLSAAGSVLVVTPVLLMLANGTPSWGSLVRRLETWLVLSLLLATTLFVFFGPGLGPLGITASMAPFPVLIWAGSRLGPRGAVMASFLVISIATIATGAGSGPLVIETTIEVMIQLWAYSTFMGISAFTLAAVIEQRNVINRRYRSEEAERLLAEKQRLLLLERQRLTREMHDGPGSQLVSALSMVERGLAAPAEVAETIRRAIDDIRIVIDSLDPETTDLPTSLGKLRARLEPLLRRNGIDLRWMIDDIPGLDSIPPEAALHVLRIIQEAVTNTLRHADAGHVEVRVTSLDHEPWQLHVSIRDDGRGLPTPAPSDGRGLKNMKSRAEELGAVLRTQGTHSGTQVELTIPFPR